MVFVDSNHAVKKSIMNHQSRTEEFANSAILPKMNLGNQEERQLIRQINQAQKFETVALLTSGIIHDISNIMQIIHYHAETSLHIDDVEENRSHLVKIHEASGRIFDILNQMWRIRGLIDEGAVHRVSLTAVVNNVVDMVGPVLPDGVKIRQEYEPGADFLMGNPTLLNQALLNLVMNASQAMPEKKGLIEISLHTDQLETGRYLVLGVKDNGIGMDSQTLDNIFTPFFTTKPKGEGTGLGLSTIRNIVVAHKGQIRVTSEAGKGSLFQILFPGVEGE